MTLRRRVIVAEPENSETPINDLRSWVTPNRLFFVRNHFDVPEIDPASWTLRVGGCVERELELGWAEIEQLPTRSVFATMECAGNGRSFLEKPGHGVQWGAGAVGHAEWTGPTLRAVLDQAGITDQALEVVFAGADRGTEADHPKTMSFARSLPLDKALHEDTLLATAMNGEPLDPAHGFPVRLVVPGWYGVASVKWLTRIELSDKPFQGYFQTTKYTTLRQTARGAVEEVVGEMQPKSEILRPREGETLGVGLNRILGAAWAGPDRVAAVEVSTDGGRTWSQAELAGMSAKYSWTLWEYSWRPDQAGPRRLVSRAISESGRVQPLKHDPLCGGYLIHHSRPVEVEVDASWATGAVDYSEQALTGALAETTEERTHMKLDVEMQYGDGGGI